MYIIDIYLVAYLIFQIFYYSVSIFLKAGLSATAAEWTNLGAGSLNLAISLIGPYLMARFNRRPLFLFSTFFSGVSLMAFALLLYFIVSITSSCSVERLI